MTDVMQATHPAPRPDVEQLASPLLTPINEEAITASHDVSPTQSPDRRLRRVSGILLPRQRKHPLQSNSVDTDERDAVRDRSNSVPVDTLESPHSSDTFPDEWGRRRGGGGAGEGDMALHKHTPMLNGEAGQLHQMDSGWEPSSTTLAPSIPLTCRPSNDQRTAQSRPRLPRVVSIPQPTSARYATGENHRVLSTSSRRLSHALDDSPPDLDHTARSKNSMQQPLLSPPPSPVPESIPLPPHSIPTHLHLELSASRPSPLYIHHSSSNDTPYEPSRVKFERLMNFLLLPPQLERVLLFGALTCLDAWLYTFTILPLRFLKALCILMEWAASSTWKEAHFVACFTYEGLGRIWHRRKRKQSNPPESLEGTAVRRPSPTDGRSTALDTDVRPTIRQLNGAAIAPQPPRGRRRHRHAKSIPSLLQSNHKADLLQGLLIICSCTLLMRFDASRMYHAIRGQAAIKLYVIYNVLEVGDRLLSAIGQDIIECLFSPSTLERKPNGRSKLLTPFWMFLLALVYTVLHATCFFYQVVALNVAVNSYSNALLTLLMSNQFVEIKGTVFKKIEKENLFQLTCADVVERFQLWLMLVIIALRNIVELGGLSLSAPFSSSSTSDFSATSGAPNPNITTAASTSTTTNNNWPASILPHAFTLLPTFSINTLQLQLLTPFALVLGSEMLVDYLKHAFIGKFNAIAPNVYARYFDVLAKDYYANAFGPQNLVRRLGLPVIPLSCLAIRSILQTWHMFLATNVSSTLPILSSDTAANVVSDGSGNVRTSPALAQIDAIFRNALGRSSFGGGAAAPAANPHWWSAWTLDDIIAFTTMLVFFLAVYLLLLAFKLVLGMVLLRIARERYAGMKARKGAQIVERESRRLGPGGVVEVGEERRGVIYEEDEAGLRAVREREWKGRERAEREERRGGKGDGDRLEGVERYAMVAKRIW